MEELEDFPTEKLQYNHLKQIWYSASRFNCWAAKYARTVYDDIEPAKIGVFIKIARHHYT